MRRQVAIPVEKTGQYEPHLIARNKRLFKNYCEMRQRWARQLDREKTSVAFEMIPVLLTLNEPGLPGYVPEAGREFGVYGAGSSNYLKKVIRDYFPEMRNRRIAFQRYLIKRPLIEALFLMGSVGTIAQKEGSDFDFWICLDEARSTGFLLQNLTRKTEKISRWCQRQFGMEVHFFVMDVEQIRRDDFGAVDEESAGSSQKTLLKEEFYRTLLLVAGKIPFWWVLSPELAQDDYENWWKWWSGRDDYDVEDFVDLGYPGRVPQEEFLGATLWHLSKGIKNPFKALIKMTMLESYLAEGFQKPLPCEVLKERVLEGANNLQEMDPYLLMFENGVDFYARQERWDAVELLKKAFYLKVDPQISRMRLRMGSDDYRVAVFKDLMTRWQWSVDWFEDLNQIESWSYARHKKLSEQINRFFFNIYRWVRKTLPADKNHSIHEHDLILLGRKLYVLFARRKNKLQLKPFLTKKRMILDKCIFRFSRQRSGRNQWTVYDATTYPAEKNNKPARIFSSNRVARAAAWLVINGLYDFHSTKVEMPPNPSGLNVNELIDLLKHLQGSFVPGIFQVKLGAKLEAGAQYERILILIGLEETEGEEESANLDLVIENTWGELFIETYPFQEGLSVIRDYASALHAEDAHELTSKVKVHVPKSAENTEARKSIYRAIMQGR